MKARNTIRFNRETGQIDADIYIQTTCEVKCHCGNPMTIVLSLPEGLSVRASINITDVACGACGQSVVLPEAHYWIENYRLMSEPL